MTSASRRDGPENAEQPREHAGAQCVVRQANDPAGVSGRLGATSHLRGGTGRSDTDTDEDCVFGPGHARDEHVSHGHRCEAEIAGLGGPTAALVQCCFRPAPRPVHSASSDVLVLGPTRSQTPPYPSSG